jgi:hypothetical protein
MFHGRSTARTSRSAEASQPDRGISHQPSAVASSVASWIHSGAATLPALVSRVNLVVDDITQARQHLVDNGVDVEEVTELGGMHYAGIVDPDGNTWTLQQINR